MIVRSRAYAPEGAPPPGALLKSVLAEHERDAPRLEKLERYYRGEHAIDVRRRTEGLPNNRIAHDYAHYIATLAAGYLIGSPVAYADEKQKVALAAVLESYRRCDVGSVDAELARKASVYGKAVELAFLDGDGEPRVAALDPKSAFVVYDDTVESRPLFGVHCAARGKIDGAADGFAVSVYAPWAEYRYRVSSLMDIESAAPEAVRANYFLDVPLVEYWNNDDERGDFEGVLSLIDAYDVLQSDRVNDKEQFVDALLVLTGCQLEDERDEKGVVLRTAGRRLREDKSLVLPDVDARVEWLYKQLAEADTDVLRAALNADIHKMSMVPDMTDQQFAGNSSGVAMRYKLLGFELLTKTKERWFREGLRARLRLFARIALVKGRPALDADMVQMVFTRSLPVNDLEIAQTVATLKNLVPDRLLLEQVPFVEDADAAAKLMEEQRDGEAGRAQAQRPGKIGVDDISKKEYNEDARR